MTEAEPVRKSGPRRATRRAGLALALLCVAGILAVAYLYALRPGWASAVTTWPLWMVLLPLLALSLAPLGGPARRRTLLVVLVWLVTLVSLSEEPRSLARGLVGGAAREAAWALARQEGRGLRVVSYNCAGGLREAAEEAFALQPDVILLQESPGRADLQALALRQGNWQVVATADCAVLAAGQVTALPLRREDTVTTCLAQVRPAALRSGEALTVQSVHFSLPSIRWQFWRPSVWRQGQVAWEGRARQAQRVASYVPPGPAPALVGGDFNTPGGDSLFRPFVTAGLRDAFPFAGLGWPNTWMEGAPFARIDQLWLSPRLRPLRLRVVPSRNSDHRLVVCDMVVD